MFGLDEIRERGAEVDHNLESGGPPPLWARAAARGLNAALRAAGGYGGDFSSVLSVLREANAADVVFATNDTVGIPLVLLKRVGLLRPPLVYAAIGLPERLVQVRGTRMQGLYVGAFRRAARLLAYAESEADWLRDRLGPGAPPVEFVRFGVDEQAFAPSEARRIEVDVASVGADPHRDYGLLKDIAERHLELSFRVVATRDHARAVSPLPANVAVETDLKLEQVRDRLAAARVVALPVKRNSYSGATTVLLQAMALGKPVVVSRTDAIARGYGLEDGVNCRLVEPGNRSEFERVLLETLTGVDASVSLGVRARQLVERELSWERYTSTLWEILSAAASGGQPPERP